MCLRPSACPSVTLRDVSLRLPEAAPAYVVLAQVLQLRCLHDEFVDLAHDVQLFVRLKVPARQLLADSVEHLDGTGVLYLGRVLDGMMIAVYDATVRWDA